MGLILALLAALGVLFGGRMLQQPQVRQRGRAENWVQRIVTGNQREIDRNPRLQDLADELFDAARALDEMNLEDDNYTQTQQNFMEQIGEFVRARGGPDIRIMPVGFAQGNLQPEALNKVLLDCTSKQ